MILVDYECKVCARRFESLERRPAPREVTCEDPSCAGRAARAFSAPNIRIPCFSGVTRGKNDQPPPPNALDTRALAEGSSREEWRKPRKKRRLDGILRAFDAHKTYVH